MRPPSTSAWQFEHRSTHFAAWERAASTDDSSGRRTLMATALHPGSPGALAANPHELDSGPIDPSSLHFSGLTLYWTSGGQPHQQTLS